MRFIGFIFIFRFLLGVAWSEVPEGQSGFLVRVWQSQDGLPSNVVRSVVQASDGYLWVATAEGVARFDGFDFEVIEPEGELRRFRLAFYRLFATGDGVVWATTYQGGLFRADNGRLHRILDNIRTPLPPLVTQLIDVGDGLVYYKRGPEYGRIAADGTVTVVNPDDTLLAKFADDLDKQSTSGRIVEKAGRAVLKDRMGSTWTAGATGGLSVTTEGQQEMKVELPDRGQGFAVNELLEDREGNVWIASPINGLVRVRHSRVNVLDTNEGQTERAVSSVLQDHEGTWWIANRRGGVTRWTPEESRYIQLSARYYRPAAALFEDKDSQLWVASRDGSVFRYNAGVFQPQFSRTQVPSKVRSITQDSNGVLWFGGSQGLASYSGQTVRSFGKAEGIGDLDLTVLQPFHGGRIIVGTSSGRVMLGDSSGFTTIASPEVLKHQWISGILSLSANETWVTTLGSGLYLWDAKKWSCFDINDGLPDVRLTCVVSDDRGYIWMGSLSGIIRAERKQLLAHVQKPDARVQWLRLDHTDGLASRECIGGYQPAGWRAKDGLLWFPTGSGIVRVRPDFVEQNKIPPPVFLQTVRTNGVLYTGAVGPVTTDPGTARLEFRFVGLSFSAPEKITYRARLAGSDDSWRELGNQRVAAFEAVPPGKYTFEVMAVNGDGMRSVAPARISVVIPPHFWQTAWFYLSVGGLILIVAVGTGWVAARLKMRSRIQSLKIRNAREGERSRIARDLHDDLGASLTEISILAALAAEDAETTALRPSLDQLSVKAKHVVGSLDEIVWAVNPREDNLRSLVDYVAAFAREFLDIARIPLRTDVARDIPEHPLPTPQRHGVFLAVREALNNIVKHSQATEVNLRISVSDDSLEIHIEDNGCGFEPEYSSASGGNGLGNLKQRMQDAGGDCRIETFRMQGTTIFLTLPLPAPAKSVS
ncbi:MAG: two-component regulator propeller domain-containing protein [Luteolibacter sp.]|uniref:sensor histidine kinase n=1 Tax=Luteolibacter sp. TaxID=1962973 RepID=UPI0032646B3D